MFTVEIFGRNINLDFEFEAANLIEGLGVLSREIDSPKIMDTSSIFPVEFRFVGRLDHSLLYADDVLSWTAKKLGVDSLFDSHIVIDEKWTNERNKGLTGIFYKKFRFDKEVQKIVIDECTRGQTLIKEKLDQYILEKKAKEQKEQEEKKKLLQGVQWNITEKVVTDEGGKTKEYTHTFVINGKEIVIIERSVFDFGRVLNVPSGGMYSKDSNGNTVVDTLENGEWIERPVTAEEARAAEILWRYGKYPKSGVRM